MARGYPDYRYFSFPVSVSEGGTGVGTLTLYGVLLGNGTSQIIPSAAGNPYEVLRVPSLGGFPAFGALDLSQAAATVNQLPISKGGTGSSTAALTPGAGISITGTWPNNTITNTSPASALGDPVTVAHGGTGTATPALVAGANITITGTWPANTIALTSPVASPFIVGSGAGSPELHINGGAGGNRYLIFRSAGVDRWYFYANSTAESGGNAGSEFVITRLSDAGGSLGTALFVRRSDGQVGIGNAAPGKMLDVTGDVRASLQLISTVATGTAPLAVTSTTEVTNLNADRVGGTEVTNAATAGLLLIGSGAGTAAWSTPDGCRVYNDVNESIADNTSTTLTFNAEHYDNGGLHDTVTNNSRLTAQKAGVYAISGHVEYAANATGSRSLIIQLSAGSIIANERRAAHPTAATDISIATLYHLGVGDYVTLVVFQNSGGALNVLYQPYFSPEFAMQWIGP